jgi:hypothetical protein
MSPVRYQGTLTFNGTGVLVFEQSFGGGWNLSVSRGAHVVRHFVANGFANGWQLSGKGSITWSLTYTPQRFITIGNLCGAILLMGCLGWLALGLTWYRGRWKLPGEAGVAKS